VARLYLPDTNTSRQLVLAIADSLKVMDRHGNVSSISQRDDKWSHLCSKRYVNLPGYIMIILLYLFPGYWGQRVDDKLGDPPPMVHSRAFSDQRPAIERTLWQCTAVCVAGVHCWEISLEYDSCLILGFSLAFIVLCRLLLGSSYYVYFTVVFCVFVVLV